MKKGMSILSPMSSLVNWLDYRLLLWTTYFLYYCVGMIKRDCLHLCLHEIVYVSCRFFLLLFNFFLHKTCKQVMTGHLNNFTVYHIQMSGQTTPELRELSARD